MDDHGSNIDRHVRIGAPDLWALKRAKALYGTVFSAILGALLFANIGHMLVPAWLVEFGFVGFIVGAAAYVALAARLTKTRSKDEYAQGVSRTDEEVRQALAEMRARKKWSK
ncbi:hypothetical protein [Tateyamaria omphalii]|uniref:Uncharacterized protein n=1 Tax=Tateyamaria omphalii TaxID=299262 RepID=A0A1P8MU25_9RHOB|nr:hypothetical protein [Tateyamaria omphalii]APX11531.1 hypothetical protein BWR18_07430 [Tateyamaria omphalii]